MPKNYAYLNTIPDRIDFSLPFSDGSGKRLSVKIDGKKTDIVIEDSGDSILINVDDIDWLRDVLSDIKSITKMNEVEPKTTDNATP